MLKHAVGWFVGGEEMWGGFELPLNLFAHSGNEESPSVVDD